MSNLDEVSSSRFYGEYHGHRVEDLEILLPRLRAATDSLIWTAGDSSLDNKHWFDDVISNSVIIIIITHGLVTRL